MSIPSKQPGKEKNNQKKARWLEGALQSIYEVRSLKMDKLRSETAELLQAPGTGSFAAQGRPG